VLPTLSSVTLQKGALTALNFSQPVQAIPQEPLAPAASNFMLSQSTTVITPAGQKAPDVAALLNSLNQPIDPTIDYGVNVQPPAGQTVRDGHLGPTPHIVTYDQEQGRIAIANKVAQLRAGTQITSPVIGPQLGAPLGNWGNPQGDSEPTTDGAGRMQVFQGGNIYWSPATAKMDIEHGVDPSIAGAHFIKAGDMLQRYYTQGGTQWGYPMTDTSDLPGAPGTTFNSFYTPNNNFATTDHQRDSMIVSTSGVGTFVLSGETMYKWIELGAGKYGVPTSEKAVQGFGALGIYSQNFRWGGPGGPTATIFWSADTGTHDLVGQTLETYRSLGGPLGIGTPTTDSTLAMRSGPNILNPLVHFRKFVFDDPSPHDSALGTTNNNTYLITGSMYTAWYSSGGASFGMPISSEHNLDAAGYYRYMYFVSPEGKAKRIVWATAPPDDYHGSGPIFFIDNLDGGGLQRSYSPPISGPTGFEQIEGPTGTVSTPLTVTTPAYSSIFKLSAVEQSLLWQTTNPLKLLQTAAVEQTTQQWVDAAFQTSDYVADPSHMADVYGSLFLPGSSGAQPSPPLPADTGSPSPDPAAAVAAAVPDLTGVTFDLRVVHGGQTHQLLILGQTNAPDGSPASEGVTFSAVWDPADGGGSQVTVTLSQDGAGNVLLHFTWASPADGTEYTFDGIVTGDAGSYHLDGTALTGPDDGHLHLVGDQAQAPAAAAAPVADLSGVSLVVPDDNGTAHQLQITTQTAQPDGSATFTGTCDGQSGTGTLAFDAAGNVHLTFTGDDGSTVDGTISGTPDAYQFDGKFTPPDVQTPDVASEQSAAPAAPVTDFTNVSFTLTEGDGTAHEFQVDNQTAQPDGSATFTGTWDGAEVSGTLAYDSAGNITMKFSGDAVQFGGTISGDPGASVIDGSVTAAGAEPFLVSGSQNQPLAA
jgi:uncharacterized protein with LGFP repeats